MLSKKMLSKCIIILIVRFPTKSSEIEDQRERTGNMNDCVILFHR